MTLTRPARFDIPGVSPDWQARMEAEFVQLLGSIPKPVAPEPEEEQ